MQVNLNSNTSLVKPQFKANIRQADSNDAISELINENPVGIYASSLALKEAPSEDVIKITKGKISYEELCKLSSEDADFWSRYANHQQVGAYFVEYIRDNAVLKKTFLATLPTDVSSKLLTKIVNGEVFPQKIQTRPKSSITEYEYKAISNLSSNNFINGIEEDDNKINFLFYKLKDIISRLDNAKANSAEFLIDSLKKQKNELFLQKNNIENIMLNKRINFVKSLLKVR